MDQGSGVEVHSKHPLTLTANDTITFAGKSISMSATESMRLTCGSSSLVFDGITDIQGQVLTKARKLKNNLSKSKLVKRFKKAVKKAVKKAAKKAVKAVKTATKTLVQAKKNDVNVATKKASKAAASIVQKSKYINLENSCPVEQSVKKPGILLTLLSAIADFVPFLGNAKAGFEAYEGYDPITKKELDYTDRGIATAGIILGGIAKVAKGGKVATELISESKNATNVAETAANSSKNTTSVISSLKQDPRLVKAAEQMGKDKVIQQEADELIQKFISGNTNPGLGSKNLFGNISYLRGRNGARVFYRMNDGKMEILGKSNKKNEQTVINILKELYGE